MAVVDTRKLKILKLIDAKWVFEKSMFVHILRICINLRVSACPFKIVNNRPNRVTFQIAFRIQYNI